MATGDHSFKQLLEQSRQLTNHVVPTDLPKLDRSLEQIDAQTKRLLKRNLRGDSGPGPGSSSAPPAVDTRTAYLLARRGHDAERVTNTLNQINLSGTFEPLAGIRDTDIDGYLTNEHENVISMSIEEGKAQTVKAYEEEFERLLHRDWERAKTKIFEELGQHRAAAAMTGTPSATQAASIPGRNFAASIGPESRATDMEMEDGFSLVDTRATGKINMDQRLKHYLPVVKDLNEKRRLKVDFDVIHEFKKAGEGAVSDAAHKRIHACWDLLYRMLGGQDDDGRSSRLVLKERQFADVYIDSPDGENGVRFRQTMVEGGRRWLQENFYKICVEYVRNQRAEVGGMPSVHNYVHENLRLRFFKNGRWSFDWLELTNNGTPFWAHLFTLVRCGRQDEALEYVSQHSSWLAQKPTNRNFETYFRAWKHSADGRLPKNLRNNLLADWNASIRDYVGPKGPTGDMFKYALYKIIGRCELNSKNIRCKEVIWSTEDYAWLQLMLVQEGTLPTDSNQERYTLRDMAVNMLNYGLAHFRNHAMWFTILILSGEFECAVYELSKTDLFAVDAVHFAIALGYLGVLRIPETPDVQGGLLKIREITLPSGLPYGVHAFNFPQVIQNFAKRWGQTDPVDVLHYVYILGLLGKKAGTPEAASGQTRPTEGRDYINLAHQLIRDVILASGEFDLLVGEVQPDGSRKIGEVEKYRALVQLPTFEEFVERITAQAAKEADRRGRFRDSIRLYHLAGQYGKVVEILTHTLSEHLTTQRQYQSSQPDRGRDRPPSAFPADSTGQVIDPVQLAEQTTSFYAAHPTIYSKVPPETRETCRILISLAHFMKVATDGHYINALKILADTGLTPTNSDPFEIQRKAESFARLDPNVTRVTPEVFSMAMYCLRDAYESAAKARMGHDKFASREQKLVEFKQWANALMHFAGALNYRVPSDTLVEMNRALVQMG
ncbi:hypothetical protein HK104_007454 [Borealophlyctis nickersoniae]|nr:hypothetical protein HK104_007454 [Borealophlyctis nickersoniae]